MVAVLCWPATATGAGLLSGAASAGAGGAVGGAVGSAVGTATGSALAGNAAGGAAGFVAAASAPAAGAAVVALASNPATWIVLAGCDMEEVSGGWALTWDCWKPVVRYDEGDEKNISVSKEGAVLVPDLLAHPAVVDKELRDKEWIVTNKWNESFRIFKVLLPDGRVAAHAERI